MASKLQDLINRLCPNGVEYRRLGEIATDVFRGGGILRNQVTETGVPCVRYGEIYTTYGIWFDECVSHTKLEYIQSPKYFEHGDILFAITGESVEEIAKSTAYTGHERCLAGGDIVVLKHKQNPKYLAYALSTSGAQEQKSKGKVKSKVVHSSVPAIKDILIPVPPLEVQSEIVQILDNFAELTAELTAELEKRKKQYEHYRRALLCGVESSELRVESSAWPMVKLGDVCEMKAGKAIAAVKISAELDEQHPVACYGANGFRGYVAEPNQDGDHCIIGRQGALCGNVCFASGRFYATEHAVVVTQLGKYDDRYLYHMLTEMDLNQYKSQGAQPGLSIGKLEELSIPLPPLAEQRRIVSILDRFDRLCNDLTSGLPAEIAARKKQYAYYRDKLLAFPRGCNELFMFHQYHAD